MLVFLTEVFYQFLFYFQINLVGVLRSYQEKRKIRQKLRSFGANVFSVIFNDFIMWLTMSRQDLDESCTVIG